VWDLNEIKADAMKVAIIKAGVVFSLFFSSNNAFACINCNKEIREAIFDSTFYPNLFVILLPFIALAFVVAVISAASVKKHRANLTAYPDKQHLSPVPLMAAATVLGIGLGGFIDGIVFHQILQWHEMLSNKIPPTTYVAKSVNMFWDGIFHAFTLLVTFTGVILLWKLLNRKDINRSRNLLAGGMLFGWGLFNLLEGIADHQLLKLHNVREITPDKEIWNVGFLAFSVILIIAGLLISKKKREEDKFYHLS
jgi:uncharacterized membrane protein